MDTKLNQWLTLAANAGVLIGLVVLILEVRQASAIAEAQFFLDRIETNETLEFAMLGDNPAAVWEQSLFSPESLSAADVRVMDGYLSAVLFSWWNLFALEQRGFVESGRTAQNINLSAEFYFGSTFAQTWWQHERDHGGWGDELSAIIESAMLETDPSANRRRVAKLQGTSQQPVPEQ
jgi:hypothetical protein